MLGIGGALLAVASAAEAACDTGGAVAIGTVVTDSCTSSIGNNNSSGQATAIGTGNLSTGQGAVAIGVTNLATAAGTVAIGQTAAAPAANAIAIGTNSSSQMGGGIAIGGGATVLNNGIAVTLETTNRRDPTLASFLLYPNSGSTLTTPTGIAIGASISNSGGVAVGNNNIASSPGARPAFAFGSDNRASGDVSVAIGFANTTSALSSTAVGVFNQASGNGSLALGRQSIASGDFSIAQGNVATASAANAIALGNSSNAAAVGAIAIGAGQNTTSTAIDPTASSATALNAVAIGASAVSAQVGGVALGAASVGGANNNSSGSISLPTTGPVAVGFNNAGNTLVGAVSVGSAGNTRQLQNLGDGSAATDAVTVRQLSSVASAANAGLNAIGTGVASGLGGGAAYDSATGTVSAPTYSVGGATYSNVGAALGAQNSIVSNQGTTTAAALGGSAVYNPATGAISGQHFVLGGTAYGDVTSAFAAVGASVQAVAAGVSNLGQTAVQYDSSTKNSVTLGGVTSTDGGVTQGTRITNLARGAVNATSTDAVNGSQLFGVTQQIAAINGGAGVRYFHANSTAADSVASGAQSVAIGPQAQAGGDSAIALGNGAQASAAGSVAIGANAVASRGAESYVGAYTGVLNTSAGTVSIGSAGAARTLSNLADGRLATDAVNLRQLDGAVQQANAYTDTSIASVTAGASFFKANNSNQLPASLPSGANSVVGGAGAVASGTGGTALGNGANASANNAVALGAGSVADRANSVSVGAAGAERQVTNLATGSAPTDAVNLGQLNTGLQNTLNQANAYTDQKVNALANEVQSIEKRAYAGTASAMAVAGMPQSVLPGKGMLAAAVSAYQGESALAIGVSALTDSARWVYKFGGSVNTRGQGGVVAGAGFHW